MNNSPFDRITQFVLRKRQAYRALFAPGPATDIVLADLKSFCRGAKSPAVVSPVTRQMDPMATGIAIGRQEVWFRIVTNLNISDADLFKLLDSDNSGTD